MANKTSIILSGAKGRMGKAIIACANKGVEFTIEAQVLRPKSVLHDKNTQFDNIYKAIKEKKQDCSVVIDFSNYQALKDNLLASKENNVPIVIGSTGHTKENFKLIKEVSENVAVLYASNTSLMANLLSHLSKVCAQALKDADFGILDIHHIHKRDAPSGTAKMLEKAILSVRQKGKNQEHNISSLRISEVIGEHTVYFANKNERIELSHKVANRDVFAEGALIAAQFIKDKSPGLYDMRHVLNL